METTSREQVVAEIVMMTGYTTLALCSASAAFVTVLPVSSGHAADDRGEGVKTVYRSMVEFPRIATPGKMVDFLDERWVEDTHCLTRELNKAETLPEPVLKHENINCTVAASGTVLRRDDGTFGFYYQTTPRFKPWGGIPKDIPAKKWQGGLYKYFLHYATSKDGIHWELPNLGLRRSYLINEKSEIVSVEGEEQMQVKWLDDKHNNIVLSLNEKDADGRQLTGSSGPAGGFCVIDAKQTPHPAARGRYTVLYQSGGLALAYSDDGFQWTAYEGNPFRRQSSDTYNTLMYDPHREEYAVFCRPRWGRGGPDPRAVTRISSKDLLHWGAERIILQTDDRDAPAHGRRKDRGTMKGSKFYTRGRELQFYGFTPKIYQDLYIGCVLVYDTFAAVSWYELVHSYDGLEWKREPRREPFISGTPETWNAGCMGYMAMGSPVEIGDHYYFYTQGSNTLHGYRLISVKDKGRISLVMGARVKKGRFIGYATGIHYPFERQRDKVKIPPHWVDRGMLMTRPFALKAEKLFLNAKVREGGSITVEIRNGRDATDASATTDALKGYGRESCNPIRNADAIKVPVTFKDTDLKALHGQSIRLLMYLENATVYGLSFH